MKASFPRSGSANSEMKSGGTETNGMAFEARYSGVMESPINIMMTPANPNTRGTVRAVNPIDARSGQGLASMRGMVGIKSNPKGQNSHDEGNKPRA
uniref:Uncharacterized protein n=1 Tax=uncultured archaeon MedDCM-OCT-S09-C50 TaxID=743102 RepID=D6PC65_9ARCH|nr:hypothetical protein [uncultured archaeon MedDCM-OCT-S09-C50]